MVEKLHTLWENFKNYLNNKHKEITIDDLIVRLHIEENNSILHKKESYVQNVEAKAKMIGDFGSKSKRRKQHILSKDVGKENDAKCQELMGGHKSHSSHLWR